MEPTEQNMRAWEEVHRRRAAAMREQPALPEVVRLALADLHGKRVLHLDCATGEATVELAALGAVVTGVDASAEALDAARAREQSVLWIHADAQRLPAEVRRARFDLVYVGQGAVASHDDLDAWARGIEQALSRAGDLLVYDEHPVGATMDAFGRAEGDYFAQRWRLGQIVSAVARAGLVVKALEEYPGPTSWRRLDRRMPGTFLLHARKP